MAAVLLAPLAAAASEPLLVAARTLEQGAERVEPANSATIEAPVVYSPMALLKKRLQLLDITEEMLRDFKNEGALCALPECEAVEDDDVEWAARDVLKTFLKRPIHWVRWGVPSPSVYSRQQSWAQAGSTGKMVAPEIDVASNVSPLPTEVSGMQVMPLRSAGTPEGFDPLQIAGFVVSLAALVVTVWLGWPAMRLSTHQLRQAMATPQPVPAGGPPAPAAPLMAEPVESRTSRPRRQRVRTTQRSPGS